MRVRAPVNLGQEAGHEKAVSRIGRIGYATPKRLLQVQKETVSILQRHTFMPDVIGEQIAVRGLV